MLGDSITALAGQYPTENWYGYANNSLGFPTTVIANEGVGGERTDQILARVGDVTDVPPAFCTVLGGTNDVSQAVTAATIQTNLTAIYDALETAGIPFIAFTIPPSTGFDAGEATVRDAVNDWLRANVETTWPDALLCDWVDDLGSDASTPFAGYLKDAVHFSATGARAAGEAFRPVLAEMAQRVG